jgi:hypothetical protein
MGYGTILSPVLLIIGFNPLLIIPSILISQAFGGFFATLFHQKLKNIDFKSEKHDTRIALIVIVSGIIASILAVFLTIQIDKIFIKSYIAILVLILGIVLLSNKKFIFSWKKIVGISILSAFNKSLSGGGFGPLVTSGQIISGKNAKKAIGITVFTEAPICICGFITYLLLNGLIEPLFPTLLTIGAVAATPLGALLTKKLKENTGRKLVGIICLFLGIFTIIRTFFWV